jgi:hypothetical protein
MNRRAASIIFVALFLPLLAFGQQLQLTGLDGKSVTVSAADLKSMPRQKVSVVNGHTKQKESYEGVLLSDLLAKVDAPAGQKLHGQALLTYVKAGARDNYQVLFSLAEIDQTTHKNQIMVADQMDGKAIDTKEGPLKLIVPEDTHPSRSIRMLTSISVHKAE